MSWRGFWKSLFSTSHLNVRVEGEDQHGTSFVARLPYGEPLATKEQQEAFLRYAKQRLWVDKSVEVRTMRIVGACEVWDELQPTGKVSFRATLEDGRSLSGRMPYEGDLSLDPDFADIKKILADQLLVKTGQRCTQVHITGAY